MTHTPAEINPYPAEWWYTGDRVEPDCDCAVMWPRERTDGERYWVICPECGDLFDSRTAKFPRATA